MPSFVAFIKQGPAPPDGNSEKKFFLVVNSSRDGSQNVIEAEGEINAC